MTDNQLAVLLWQYTHQLDIAIDNLAEALMPDVSVDPQQCTGCLEAFQDLAAHLHEDIDLLMGIP